jgi:hypothetical protein
MGSNVYMFLIALIKKKERKKGKEYLNEGGENCVMRRSIICAVTKYYQCDKI